MYIQFLDIKHTLNNTKTESVNQTTPAAPPHHRT
jgi:hypothetical protein